MIDTILSTILLIWIIVSVAFAISLIVKRNDIADVLWGVYPALTAGLFFLAGDRSFVAGFITVFIVMWGLRLTLHIGSRNLRKSEDPRYVQWRMDWGRWFLLRSYVQIYLLQGFLSILVMMPALILYEYGIVSVWSPFFLYVGAALWCVGFFFESVGDYQLRRFIENRENCGKIMMRGLWSYTRHPNYFGEVLLWWGVFVMIFGVYGFAMPTTYAMISPVVVSILILCVSGIPMTEKRYEGNTDFDQYKNRTNAFFPGPHKS